MIVTEVREDMKDSREGSFSSLRVRSGVRKDGRGWCVGLRMS